MKLKFVAFFMLLLSNAVLSQETAKFTTDEQLAVAVGDGHSTVYAEELSEKGSRADSVRIFSLSPIHSRVNKVNGLTLGVGHYRNSKIGLFTFGLGIAFESLIVGARKEPYDSFSLNRTFLKRDDAIIHIRINGLNVSSGGFLTGAQVNGLNICVVSVMNKMNGVSVTAAILSTENMNGISVCGIANMINTGSGLQLAVSNVSREYRGVQIGLFNNAKNLRGVQLGLWNTNGKRRLPFVNWQFKS